VRAVAQVLLVADVPGHLSLLAEGPRPDSRHFKCCVYVNTTLPQDGITYGAVVDNRSDFDPDVATWKQLADRLRKAIRSGELAPGQRVPSELSLTQEYRLSRLTIRRALQQLRGEGLIVVVQSRGTFVKGEQERTVVTLGNGDQAQARMPDPEERRKYSLHEGEPVVLVTRVNGTVEGYGAHTVTVVGG
jgi:DNA-binding transcriptional regulator YhcF (GntR family)